MIRRLWPWLRMLVGLAILVALAWKVGAGAFLDGLRVIDAGTVLAALGLGLVTTVCSAWRWCLVARRMGLRLGLPGAVADYYRALLLNAVLPAGVLGDAHRAVSHGRRSGDVRRGVRAVVLERLAGQVALVTVGVAVLLTRPDLLAALVSHLALPGRGLLVAAVGALAAAVGVAAWVRFGPGRARWRPALRTTLCDARVLLAPAVLALSVTALLGYLALFLVAARAAGADAPVTRLLPLLLLALLAMSLPVNIGGWGPREAACALAFGAAGLDAAQGLTTAVVYGVLAMVACLPGVAVLLLRRGAVRRREGGQVATERLDQAGQQLPPLVGRGE
ncbi:MAG TPA: lysylphosphatidylglycerol synthase transmembrane domain-containing protein [Pseudonocardia sp.]|jgi:uncharacterized membrane protein YbhN (UPF0104 family)